MTRTTFRTLLIANWVLALAAYAASVSGALPDGVREAVGAANAAGMPFGADTYNVLAYVYFFLFLVSTVGLFAFRDFARALYAGYVAMGFLLGMAIPVTALTRPAYFVGGLFTFSSMLILTLIYFSPVRGHFGAGRAKGLD